MDTKLSWNVIFTLKPKLSLIFVVETMPLHEKSNQTPKIQIQITLHEHLSFLSLTLLVGWRQMCLMSLFNLLDVHEKGKILLLDCEKEKILLPFCEKLKILPPGCEKVKTLRQGNKGAEREKDKILF